MCILLPPEYFRTGVYSIRVIQCGAKSVEILLRIFIHLRWAIRSSGETELPEIFKLYLQYREEQWGDWSKCKDKLVTAHPCQRQAR